MDNDDDECGGSFCGWNIISLAVYGEVNCGFGLVGRWYHGAAGVCCRRELLVPEKAFVFHDFVHSRLTANDL